MKAESGEVQFWKSSNKSEVEMGPESHALFISYVTRMEEETSSHLKLISEFHLRGWEVFEGRGQCRTALKCLEPEHR